MMIRLFSPAMANNRAWTNLTDQAFRVNKQFHWAVEARGSIYGERQEETRKGH